MQKQNLDETNEIKYFEVIQATWKGQTYEGTPNKLRKLWRNDRERRAALKGD